MADSDGDDNPSPVADGPSPPELDDDVTFDAPWQARAFSLAVTLCDRGDEYDWADFQRRLVDRLDGVDDRAFGDDVERTYYEQWLAAFVDLLVDEGIASREEIERRKAEFSRGERDASEFVAGDRSH